jgi:7,8-dihydropterin-6-yl-methyl-4-(beta-D-ribofuranosyl)aminobenzene 5'-phosphate synthase
MKIKIIAVGSNRWERFIRRWGVSFLIDEDILFDTFGDPGVLLNNIRRFNIDTGKIKHIVLSHDDWDHISGLWYLIDNRKDITVYICPGFKQVIKDRIASFGARLVEVEPFAAIKENVFTSGQMPASCAGGSIFEQALIVKFLKSLTIITGCAHPGIINIIDTVKKHFLKEQVYFILGGLHLKDNSETVNLNIIEKIREIGVRKIAPMHCTGKSATKMMRGIFGYGFVQAKEGDTIEL